MPLALLIIALIVIVSMFPPAPPYNKLAYVVIAILVFLFVIQVVESSGLLAGSLGLGHCVR
jgi:hypothetical protein